MKHPLKKPDFPKGTGKKEKERIKKEFDLDLAGKKKKTNKGFIAYA